RCDHSRPLIPRGVVFSAKSVGQCQLVHLVSLVGEPDSSLRADGPYRPDPLPAAPAFRDLVEQGGDFGIGVGGRGLAPERGGEEQEGEEPAAKHSGIVKEGKRHKEKGKCIGPSIASATSG